MATDTHICTACGYEGRPVRAPDDSAGEDPSFIIGFAEKLIFMLTFLPIKFGWIARLTKRGKAKHCPNCGLPMMVKMKSDAGWMTKRKLEIRSGILVIGEDGKPRPGTGVSKVLPQVVTQEDPGKLGAVDETVWERDPEPVKEEVVEKPVEKPVTKKPVDPDEW